MTLDAAIEYARRGWSVFPVCPGTKRPACTHGVHDATDNPALLQDLWSKAGEDAGVAVACGGQSRLVVIDVDGALGEHFFAELVAKLGQLPPTLTVRTPRGGRHLYFAFPGVSELPKNSVGKIAKKVDVRSAGGYVVMPPTPGYTWTTEVAPAELPPAWVEFLTDVPASPPNGNGNGSRPGGGYVGAALQRAVQAVAAASEGERNATLNREAYSLAGLRELDDDVIASELLSAARQAGLPEREARKTIASGISAGRSAPRIVPEPSPAVAPAAPAVAPPAEVAWQRMLRFSAKGRLEKDVGNVALWLAHEPSWAGCLEYDAFADQITWVRSPPTLPGLVSPSRGQLFEEWHLTYVGHAIAKTAGTGFSKAVLWDGLVTAARQRTVHPLQDYLRGLEWDGQPRLSTWLTRYLGAEDSDYTRACGRWWAISAVARALQPGCQADHVIVLEGAQGAGKTTAVRLLAGDWYLGSLPDLRDKDAVQVLSGRWLVELGELDALRGAGATRIKDFVSQTWDVFRPSYGRTPVRRGRGVAFMGTTNENHYLDDPTGARRWWPVRVSRCDRDALEQDRDQIWAEAMTHYLDGASWHPSPELASAIKDEQEARLQGDPWEDPIDSWCRGRDDVSTGEVLWGALQLEMSKWGRAEQTRVGHILRRLGYEAYRPRTGGRVRRYRLGGETTE